MKARLLLPTISIYLSIFMAAPVMAADKIVRLVADEWCPYNCSLDNKDKPGYIIDIAKAIFTKAGYKVEYQIMPFERAMQDVLNGKFEGVVGLDADTQATAQQANEKSARFLLSNKIGVSSVVFFVAADSHWQYNPAKPDESLQALDGKVGIPQGYSYDIMPLLLKHDAVLEAGGETPMADLLNMLDKGRVKAVIDDDKVIDSIANANHLSGKFKPAGLAGKPLDLYIGFGPEQKVLQDIFNKGFAEMRANGELAKILKKYRMKDWQ